MGIRFCWSVAWLLLTLSLAAHAQEGGLQGELRREGQRVSDACGSFSFKSVPSCAYTLFTDHPLHIAAGSLPPQNGFGLGGAFVWSKNTRNWRMSWDFDSVGTFSGSWRAGGYMKMIHTPRSSGPQATHPYTVFNFYAQSISLNKINFFGLGNDAPLSGKSLFGMGETVVGASVIKPVYELRSIRWLNLSLQGEVNGRFVDLRGKHGESSPSIETLYDNATAPGLISQPAFVQLGEGVRIKPELGNLQFNYLGKFQQFFAPSNSQNSFLRWTVDLDHNYSLYSVSHPGGSESLGPDSCARGEDKCPEIPRTRNLNGSIDVRLLISESLTSGTSVVPFYFQPTLGGSDLNSFMSLGSYQDYRFRAPNILLLQEYIEHSIWGPFGLKLMADQGRVALTRGDLGFSHLRHSYGAGLTLRAGGFPMISLMYAWGGAEGQHTIANMNTSLLGGSSRPSLF
ncbi:MAG TPA: hypothetical protein VGF06_07885 [Terriglobales bacterium]